MTTQVGCSGYRIDLAVKHPSISGVYVIGIECDGASYHSAKTARERDRLRQDVLENMGWTIHRIWSTDWAKDKKAEGEKLISAIEDAIKKFGQSNNSDPYHDESKFATLFVEEEKRPAESEDPIEFYGFARTSKTKLPFSSYNFTIDRLPGCIKMIVENEYPIHFDVLCKKLVSLFGNEKVTDRIRNNVRDTLNMMPLYIKQVDQFIYPTHGDKVHPLLPNDRDIQYISRDELCVAILGVANKLIGATTEDVLREVASVYGFGRYTPNIAKHMEAAAQSLIDNNKATVTDGKFRPVIVR